MLPKELDDIFKYNEEDCNIFISKVEYSTEDFIIDFTLDFQGFGDEDKMIQEWSIIAKGHRKNNLSFDFESFIEIRNDDPLLWEFTDTQCQLYYTGHCKDIPKLFYDLYHTHQSIFGNYKQFDISFHENGRLFKPFQFSNGLLTSGSKKMMLKYADCLKQNGLSFTIVAERPAQYWNGTTYVMESENLKILYFGKGYIIAEDFSFMKHSPNNM